MQKFVKIKHFRGFNWYGFYTLYIKEVKRIMEKDGFPTQLEVGNNYDNMVKSNI